MIYIYFRNGHYCTIECTAKVIYFSLRWYDPDQVQRVKSQSVKTDTPKVWDEVRYFLRMGKIKFAETKNPTQ